MRDAERHRGAAGDVASTACHVTTLPWPPRPEMMPVRRTLTFLLLALVLAATACGSGEEPSGAPADTDQATEAGTLTGVLGGDGQLEGGCAWIEPTGGPDADLGDRVEPLWPDGHRVEFEPDLRLLGPDGEVVAVRGDELVLEGAPAEDMATACQIGPPYRVDRITGVVGR